MATVALGLGPTAFRSEFGGHGVTLAFLWFVLFPSLYLFGLYDTERLESSRSMVAPAFACAVVIGVVDASVLIFALPSERALTGGLVAAVFVFVAILLARFAHLAAARRGLWSSRALVVGDLGQAQELSDLLAAHPHSGFRVVGMVEVVKCEPSGKPPPFPRLGFMPELDGIALSHRVEHVFLGAGLERNEKILRSLRPLRYRGVGVLDFVTLFERLAHEISISHIDDAWLFAAAMNSSRLHARWLKRLIDVVGSTVLLIPTALFVIPVAALAIKGTSKGPVFFRQERLGLGARPFMLLKLRTMRADAERLTGPVWSTDNDPRITSAGRILRKFRIDELPQLWNVLTGDMSLIGPRPERAVFVRELSAKLPLFSERLLVRPGITGWAQVMAPYASTIGDSYRKLQFDLYYAKHMSPLLDGLIIVKTVKTMLLGRERRQGGMAAGAQLAKSIETGGIPHAAISVSSAEPGAIEPTPVELSLAG